MFKSKRFVAFVVSISLFTIMIFTTKYTPMEIAGALSIIDAVYIGAQTVRGSTPEDGEA
jgi:hypothetical protein